LSRRPEVDEKGGHGLVRDAYRTTLPGQAAKPKPAAAQPKKRLPFPVR